MRKWIALLLAVVMVLSLCACGGTDEASEVVQSANENESVSVAEIEEEAAVQEPALEENPEPVVEPVVMSGWTVEQTVDEFGDITEDSANVMRTAICGDFSNTATSSSELAGYIFIRANERKTHYSVVIRLLEYGDTPATYLSSDAENLILKTKVGDTISEYQLTGTSPNGDLLLGIEEYNYAGDEFFRTLYEGNDIRCIIYIGNSQYNFTVECGNFTTLCDESGFGLPTLGLATIEAVEAMLNDVNVSNATTYFAEHREEFELMDEAKMNEILNGTQYLEITFKYQYWTFYRYNNGVKTQYARYVELYSNGKLQGRNYEETDEYNDDFTVENGLYNEYNYVGLDGSYEIRYIADGFYVTYGQDENGEFTVPDSLWVQYDESGNQMYFLE